MRRVFRVCSLGLLLYLVNFAGIIFGFMAFRYIRGNQLAIQIPAAVILSIAFFMLACWLMRKIPTLKLCPGPEDSIWIFFAALAWNPVIFIPLHFLTQGYLTDLNNILRVLFFQMPTNAIVLGLSHHFFIKQT